MISIIIPVLNEKPNLKPLLEKISATLSSVKEPYEVLFVDDGSTDGSFDEMRALSKNYPIKAVRFSRNFGHQFALTAGMDYAKNSKAVIMMDADLQHPPEMLLTLISTWKEGYEIVYTEREASDDAGFFKRWSAKVFYLSFKKLSAIDIPYNAADFRLLDQKVVDAFLQLRERTRFLRGLTAWVGYKSKGVKYKAASRLHGNTKYSLSRMIRFALDGILSFSATPLYVAIYVGIALAALGFLYAAFVLGSFFMGVELVLGWASIICLLSIIGGIQLIVLGAMGLYIGRIYEEVKQRPLYLVSETLGVM